MFQGLTVVVLAFVALYLNRRFRVNPDAVHRLALLRLNTHPGILEVMGAPLVSGDVTAMILSGGGLKLMVPLCLASPVLDKTLQGWIPHFQARRVKMVFPVHGSQRRGLVFLDAKKQKVDNVGRLFGSEVWWFVRGHTS